MKYRCVVGLLLLGVLLVAASTVVTAEGTDIRAGLQLGSLDMDGSDASGIAVYMGGTVTLPTLPVSITGSFTTFSTDEFDNADIDTGVSTLTLLAGYQFPQIPVPVKIGAGIARIGVNLDLGQYDGLLSASGLVFGAFGTYPVMDKVTAGGTLLYSPFAKVSYEYGDQDDSDNGSLMGMDIWGNYALKENIAIEAGFRTLSFSNDTDVSTGGLYAGAKMSF